MSLNQAILADRHFPAATALTKPTEPPLARPALLHSKAPPIYLVELHHRAQWRQIWRRLLTQNHLRLCGPITTATTSLTILFQGTHKNSPPLAMSAELAEIDDQSFIITSPHHTLSWRLAAIQLARSLPPQPPQSTPEHHNLAPQPIPSLPPDRPLRLRWDLPGSAASISKIPRFQHIITSLRAGFPTPRQLAQNSQLTKEELSHFLLSLSRANLLQDAPTIFAPTPNPFDFMALHWSADQKLIRQRYQLLQLAIDRHRPGRTTARRLDQAYKLLSNPALRAALRRAILPPPVIAEVITHLQQKLALAKAQDHSSQLIALCRTILELQFTPNSTRRHSPRLAS